MVLAAKWLRIPVVTMYDYEWTETRIFNVFSDKVLVPDRFSDGVLNGIGLPIYKRKKYPGIKEELYIKYFQPVADFRSQLLKQHGADENNVLAVLRPPATTANYHSEKSEVLLDDILHFLLNAHRVFTVIVPRTAEQAAILRRSAESVSDSAGRFVILDEAVDGLQLAYASDLLISGGGTMNREAALLGVPVYSIFAGRQGALDGQMEAEGLITFIRDARDLSRIKLEHRNRQDPRALTNRVEASVIETIDSFL